jgi:hypothetical protein
MSATTDWIVALSSTAAATGTVGTLYASVTVLRRQEDDRRRAQASRITVRRRQDVWPPTLIVRNGSDQAVYGVAMYLEMPGTGIPTNGDDEEPILLPGNELELTCVAAMQDIDADDLEQPTLLAAIFLDEAGRTWKREDAAGILEETGPVFRTPRSPWRRFRRWRRRRAYRRHHAARG